MEWRSYTCITHHQWLWFWLLLVSFMMLPESTTPLILTGAMSMLLESGNPHFSVLIAIKIRLFWGREHIYAFTRCLEQVHILSSIVWILIYLLTHLCMVIWSKFVLNLLQILINIYYLLNHHFNFFLSPLNQLSLTLKQAILFYYKNVFSILNCLIVWDVNLLCQLTIHRQLLFCSFCRNIFRAYITSAAVLTVTANYLSQHFIILLGIIL